MDKEHTCCFTGHRPDRLPWGADEEDPRCLALKARLADALEEEYRAGTRHFICGMARGADLYFAEAVLALRARLPGVTLECARPCESQAHSWPREEQDRYQSILDRCDFETLVQHHYDRAVWPGATATWWTTPPASSEYTTGSPRGAPLRRCSMPCARACT